MMQTIETTEVLPLKGSCNTRDLGGYPAAGGKKVRRGVCLRSDSLELLEPADIQYLKDYGVTCIIDLRSPQEREAFPAEINGLPWISYHAIPMLDQIQSGPDEVLGLPSSLTQVYLDLLSQSGASFARAAQIIADTAGTALFNCAAGKDRTGMLAMLLLDLAGVSEEEILRDYLPSGQNYSPVAERKLSILPKEQNAFYRQFFVSRKEDFDPAYQFFKSTYGDAYHYFLQNGLSPQTLDRLKEKLTEDL